MALAFIILNYQTYMDTISCVDSIVKNIDTNEYSIFIVDNGSSNNSGQLLTDKYSNEKKISVILNKRNLGFARGLNIGIFSARKQKKFDFYILLNSDTEIIGKNWNSVIEKKFELFNFHILGPDIISIDGLTHANPVKRQVRDINDLKILIKKKKKKLISNYFFIDSLIYNLKFIIKKIIRYKPIYKSKNEKDIFNVQLQGSCLILSKLYFNKKNGLFDKTFLYFEEAILRYFCDLDNMNMMYTPDIVLLHKESQSTKFDIKSLRKKKIFYLKNSLRSCEELFKIMKKDNEKSNNE